MRNLVIRTHVSWYPQFLLALLRSRLTCDMVTNFNWENMIRGKYTCALIFTIAIKENFIQLWRKVFVHLVTYAIMNSWLLIAQPTKLLTHRFRQNVASFIQMHIVLPWTVPTDLPDLWPIPQFLFVSEPKMIYRLLFLAAILGIANAAESCYYCVSPILKDCVLTKINVIRWFDENLIAGQYCVNC